MEFYEYDYQSSDILDRVGTVIDFKKNISKPPLVFTFIYSSFQLK